MAKEGTLLLCLFFSFQHSGSWTFDDNYPDFRHCLVWMFICRLSALPPPLPPIFKSFSLSPFSYISSLRNPYPYATCRSPFNLQLLLTINLRKFQTLPKAVKNERGLRDAVFLFKLKIMLIRINLRTSTTSWTRNEREIRIHFKTSERFLEGILYLESMKEEAVWKQRRSKMKEKNKNYK